MISSGIKLNSIQNTEKHTVNLLPSLDPFIMGYKDRERYVDPEYYNYIFDRSGNATSTIILDGHVIGIWDTEELFLKIFLFNKDFGTKVLREVYNKARELGTFISGKEVIIKDCDYMVPLTQRTAGGVMSPLSEN